MFCVLAGCFMRQQVDHALGSSLIAFVRQQQAAQLFEHHGMRGSNILQQRDNAMPQR